MDSDEIVLELDKIEKVVYIKDNKQVEEKNLEPYDFIKIYKSNITSYVFESSAGNKICFAYDKMQIVNNKLMCYLV